MIPKKISFILTAIIILILSTVSFAQADDPPVDDGSTTGISFGETLDFSGFNLGNIMSGKDSSDDTGEGDEDTNGADEENSDEGSGDGSEDNSSGDASENGTTEGGESEEGESSDEKEHPVARAIADYFSDILSEEVSYEDVMTLHEAGNGFGAITKAYYFTNLLSDIELPPGMTPPDDPEALLEMAHDSGWGNVLKDYGIHPGSMIGNGKGHRPDSEATAAGANGSKNHTPPGQAKKNQGATDGIDAGTSDLVGQGNGNGTGLGRSKGQGQNGGNGRSNGNGGGKNNGQGKGHNK